MPHINYTIDRKRSRKHTYITIQKDGIVLVKTNFLTSKESINHFIEQKADWIQKKRSTILDTIKLEKTKLYILGELHDKETIPFEDINHFYKIKAIEIIPPFVEKWSNIMQLYPTYIGFRKNKSRWGSCNSQNRLSFNTQLIKTPLAFIEYVVVHELAHIQHKNHSKEFWYLVETHLPDFKQRQNIIKKQHFII